MRGLKTPLLIFVLLCFAGCVTIYNPATGRKESYLFDEKAEIRWGNTLAKQFLEREKILKDEQKNRRVDQIGEKLAANSYRPDLKYHFYIIDEDTMNAFALPGGQIFIYRGLIEQVNEDELAFVLAHEIGHTEARHALKRLAPALGINLASAISAAIWDEPEHDKLRRTAGQAVGLVFLGYSREDELQADSLGLNSMVKSGFNPRGVLSLFKKFQDLEQKKGSNQPVYLRTHPFPSQRIENARRQLDELGVSLSD